jgi:hypothetical protein
MPAYIWFPFFAFVFFSIGFAAARASRRDLVDERRYLRHELTKWQNAYYRIRQQKHDLVIKYQAEKAGNK